MTVPNTLDELRKEIWYIFSDIENSGITAEHVNELATLFTEHSKQQEATYQNTVNELYKQTLPMPVPQIVCGRCAKELTQIKKNKGEDNEI